jgi:maleylacetate reductase
MILARSQQTTWEEPHEGQLENLRHCRSAGAMELTRMLYVIHGVDKPRSPIRDRLIDAHHAYLASSGLSIVGSGPLMDDLGETPIGTVIIADCASRTEAARIMAAEPFNRAGLYESLQITRWAARDRSGGERHMDAARPDNSSSRHEAGDGPGHTAPWRTVRPVMESFELKVNPARIVFGTRAIGRTGEMIRELGCSRALVLSTPHQKAEAERLAASLGDLAAGVYANATMHTPVEVTEDALAVLREAGADCTVAYGGGSTTGLGKALAYRTDLPQIAIPTTYAGSEVTPILGQTEAGRKTTVSDAKILPEVVIYDPELTYDLPAGMTVTSALNAMAHAAEALYARDRNPISSLMAGEGLRALIAALPVLRETPADPEGRAGALYGAWLCGSVLGSVGMALHHKLCHVLGGTFDLPHAETHAVILPHAVAFNEAAVPDLLSPLAKALGTERAGQGLHAYAASIGAPMTLKEIGMPEDGIDRAADQAVANPYWNPRAFDRADIRRLIENAYHGRTPD